MRPQAHDGDGAVSVGRWPVALACCNDQAPPRILLHRISQVLQWLQEQQVGVGAKACCHEQHPTPKAQMHELSPLPINKKLTAADSGVSWQVESKAESAPENAKILFSNQ